MIIAIRRIGSSQDKASSNEWEGNIGISIVVFVVTRRRPKVVVMVFGCDKLLLDWQAVTARRSQY